MKDKMVVNTSRHPKKRNNVKRYMDKFHHPKVYRSRKSELIAKDYDLEIKDYYEGEDYE